MGETMVMTETEARAAHAAAEAEYRAACVRLREACWRLPKLPADMGGEFNEVGHERIEEVEAGELDTDECECDDPHEDGCACGKATRGSHTVDSRGWSAFTDEGQAEWIEADGLVWGVPDDMDWT